MIAILVAVGSGIWAYGKVNRSNGRNTTSSLVVAAVTGLFVFVIALLLIGLIPNEG